MHHKPKFCLQIMIIVETNATKSCQMRINSMYVPNYWSHVHQNFFGMCQIVLKVFPQQNTFETFLDQAVITVIKWCHYFSYNELCRSTMLKKKVFMFLKLVLQHYLRILHVDGLKSATGANAKNSLESTIFF